MRIMSKELETTVTSINSNITAGAGTQKIWQPCGVFQMDLHGPPACVTLDHICNTAPKAWRLQMKLKVTPGCLGPMLKSCDICGSLE